MDSFNHIKFIFETLYKLHKPFINYQIKRFCENKLAKVHNIFSLINDTCRGRNGASFLSNHGCKEIRSGTETCSMGTRFVYFWH